MLYFQWWNKDSNLHTFLCCLGLNHKRVTPMPSSCHGLGRLSYNTHTAYQGKISSALNKMIQNGQNANSKDPDQHMLIRVFISRVLAAALDKRVIQIVIFSIKHTIFVLLWITSENLPICIQFTEIMFSCAEFQLLPWLAWIFRYGHSFSYLF